jgi:hypothetical protein
MFLVRFPKSSVPQNFCPLNTGRSLPVFFVRSASQNLYILKSSTQASEHFTGPGQLPFLGSGWVPQLTARLVALVTLGAQRRDSSGPVCICFRAYPTVKRYCSELAWEADSRINGILNHLASIKLQVSLTARAVRRWQLYI